MISKKSLVSILAVCLGLALPAAAQTSSENTVPASVKWMYGMVKNNILKSAAEMPEADYSYKPVDTVRSFGAILAHVADSSVMICSAAKGEKHAPTNYEKTRNTKAEIVEALNEAFGYCDAVVDSLTPESAVQSVSFFGSTRARAQVLDFNSMHNMEHYGNLVTYLRMKGMVPPSSQR